MIDEDNEKTGESGASTRAISVEPEIETVRLLSSLRREKLKAFKGLDALTALDPPVEPLDRSYSPNVALPQHSDGGAVAMDEHGAAAVANTPSASAFLQSEVGPLVLEKEEWEIAKIVGKRRARKGHEYKVRWKSTWLPRSELWNAWRLLREFEA